MSQFLYKYLPIDRISYLENELLRFTQPGDLNDPFECIPVLPSKEEAISIFRTLGKEQMDALLNEKMAKKKKSALKIELIRQHKSMITAIRNDVPNNLREQFLTSGINKINENLGIFSLSRRWDSTLMWSHYTNSHKGFCVGYNRSSTFFNTIGNQENPTSYLEKVEYSQNRVKVPIERGKKIGGEVLLTKAMDWEYEMEERIISALSLAEKKINNIPFDVYLFKVPHNSISEIIIGANIVKENYLKIKGFCIKNNIALYQSEMSDMKFNMTRKQIK